MRARLAIVVTVASIALALASEAVADAPFQEGPADGAVFTAGDNITFAARVTSGANPGMDFYVSRDASTNPPPNGILTNWFDHFRGSQASGDPTLYTASTSSDDGWPSKPGTYYWQAVQDCAAVPLCDTASQPRSFVINAKPASSVGPGNEPKTFLKRHPKHKTHQRTVRFSFYSDVKGAHFQCLFALGWKKCKSPHVFRDLKPGRYQFKVRAVVNGVKDPSAAVWFFKVLR
jgi:hypothetical protein